MTAIRERLAQMGETARAATPGPWRHGNVEKDAIFVQEFDPSLWCPEAGRVLLRTNDHFPRFAEDAAYISAVRPDVGEALIRASAALADMLTPVEGLPMHEEADLDQARYYEAQEALDALAAALGVSR